MPNRAPCLTGTVIGCSVLWDKQRRLSERPIVGAGGRMADDCRPRLARPRFRTTAAMDRVPAPANLNAPGPAATIPVRRSWHSWTVEALLVPPRCTDATVENLGLRLCERCRRCGRLRIPCPARRELSMCRTTAGEKRELMELEPAILLRTSACLEAGFHVDLPHVRLAAKDRCEEKQRCDVISLRRNVSQASKAPITYPDKNDAACVGMGPQPIARLMYGAVPRPTRGRPCLPRRFARL